MSRHLAFVLLVAWSSAVKIEKPMYLITSPHQYRVGYEETLGVQIFGSKPCEVEVRVMSGIKVYDRARGTFASGERGVLKLKVPEESVDKNDYYYQHHFNLQATVCGVVTKSRSFYARRMRLNNIIIQTDKPIYKPGQKIRLRVLSFDKDFRPKGNVAETVHVNVKGSRIKQWNNVTLEDGIASLELLLSKEPVLGKYLITAIVGGVEKGLWIEVGKYVLPKFEVKIQPPKYMALDQKEFTTSICAKYTYGKNVVGKLSAFLCLEHKDINFGPGPWITDGWRGNNFRKCQDITREIDGCTDITLSREELNVGSITNRRPTKFVIDASVTESLTQVTHKGKAYQSTLTRSTQMSFAGTSDKFKPGLPFKYVLKVTHPDGTPSTGSKVRVSISRGYFLRYFYEKTFVVTNGLITDSIDDASYNSKSLKFKAKLLDENSFPVKGFIDNVEERLTVTPWYSPTLSYLGIIKMQNTPAKIDSEGSVTVRYTVPENTAKKVDFHYTVLCKRNIVLTGKRTRHHYIPTTTANTKAITTTRFIHPRRRWWTAKPDPVKKLDTKPMVEKFDIKFPITMEMVPSCKVMVYYVREDKEVVADTVDFDVEDKLENQISMSFEDKEKRPGEKTNLVLKATPGSRVAFVAVDMSVHLLKAGNELTKDKISSYIRSQNSGKAWNNNLKCPWDHFGRQKRHIAQFWGSGSKYEDASEVFNNAGVIFISNLNINTRPCPPRPYTIRRIYFRRGRGGGPSRGGGVRISRIPVPLEKPEAKKPVTKNLLNKNEENPVQVRKEFPETWLWADEKLDKTGNKKIEVTLPDTITTWVANGFAMSSTTGLGISDSASIKAFQPFFVQMTLPYSVIRGEEIPVTVTVFNYLASCVPIKMELNHKSTDYKVTSYHINKLCVCGDAGKNIKFTIIPTTVGHIPLTVTAVTSSAKLCSNSTVVASDALTRKLHVKAEGIRKEYTQGTFFCPKNGEYKEEFDLKVPKDVVPGSLFPTVTIIGDIMGPALNNLDDLLRMPYGCGEQNMANFAPNIYIMDYLTKTHQATEGIKSKAENFMEIGYQRELTYKRKSGSYSAFGDSDSKGSMMLTAFVVRSFARAKKYIFVDDEQVKHSLKWFSSRQNERGCFPEYGKLFNKRLQGGVNSELTITAYVTTALLEAGESTNSTMVSRALICITRQLDSIKDAYTTALVTYTLILANHSDAHKMMKLLKAKAIKDGDQMYWRGEEKSKPKHGYHSYYYKSSTEVEMTAYALLAILHQGDDKSVVTDEVMDIIRWLSKQRNSYGGFASTQDTCVALQALAEFAGKAYGNSADFGTSELTGSLKIGKYYKHDFLVTKNNKLTLQTVELPAKTIPGKLEVNGRGVGCALVQASVKYNVPEPEDIPVFDINVDVRTRRSTPDEEATPCNPLKLHVTVKWLKEDVSNMAVVDVKLVTGFSVREESLDELRNDYSLNFKRYDIDGQNIMLYFDEIKDMTFSIDIHQNTLVKKLKPAVVKVYDYYEPESQAKVMYKIGETKCYGNKIEQECPRCLTVENPRDLINATVQCHSTVTRMKSQRGMLKLIKVFPKSEKVRYKKIMKQELEYQIPDFCPCEEIYDNERAIVIGQDSYFSVIGDKTKVVLNSGTTILKYTGKAMKSHIKAMNTILNRCRKSKGKN